MPVTINGRVWSITDFRAKAHTQPKSPDGSGTPAFPDGIFGDMLAEFSALRSEMAIVSSQVVAVNNASTLLAALQAVSPALASSLAGGDLVINRSGTGYAALQWSTFTASTAIAAGSRKILFDTSGGAFTMTQTGTPQTADTLEIKDGANYAATNNFTFIFNATAVIGGVEAVTCVFDTSDDYARFQFLNSKWREV